MVKQEIITTPVAQLPGLHEQDLWVGLKTVVMVVRTIQHWNKTTHEVQFYITSLASDANKISSAIPQHWGIENSVHWTFILTEGEDECPIRSMHSPQNFAFKRRGSRRFTQSCAERILRVRSQSSINLKKIARFPKSLSMGL
ncbi:ISAs1 family transposase [Brunnivagina elsteri]|uniref:ISAs1 family transposase n=1 Tax=Brunnivagina elsteri TaxID=1247191 RepID=UPI001FEAE494|nr:ISAs1 family transposase [Calothrix elsteri]